MINKKLVCPKCGLGITTYGGKMSSKMMEDMKRDKADGKAVVFISENPKMMKDKTIKCPECKADITKLIPKTK